MTFDISYASRSIRQSLAVAARQCKLAGFAVASLLAGCVTAPVTEVPSADLPALDPAYETTAGAIYRVEPGMANVTLEVYRDGPLKALGHNHVIATDKLTGVVLIANEVAESRADLWLAATDLVVDEPDARAAAGPEFNSEPTRSDIEGTTANMRSERVLNAAVHPRVHVAVRFEGVQQDRLRLTATIDAAGGSATLPIEARYAQTRDALTIDASFDLDQRDLGIEPFSVLGGAIRVAPLIKVAITLTARRLSPETETVPGAKPR